MPHPCYKWNICLSHVPPQIPLCRDPAQAAAYQVEINKLEETGYAQIIPPDQVDQAEELWYISYQMTQHKNRTESSSTVCSNMEGIMSTNSSSLIPHWALPWCLSPWSSANILSHWVVTLQACFLSSLPPKAQSLKTYRDSFLDCPFQSFPKEATIHTSYQVVHWSDRSATSQVIEVRTQCSHTYRSHALVRYRYRDGIDPSSFKVFVGMRVAEIQELTDPEAWHYVNSKSNSAKDITRGKMLAELSKLMESRPIVPPPAPRTVASESSPAATYSKCRTETSHILWTCSSHYQPNPADYNQFKSDKQLLVLKSESYTRWQPLKLPSQDASS